MARFICAECDARGEFDLSPNAQHCPDCGSFDGLRVTLTMADYPKGHPFWDEILGVREEKAQ